MTTKMTPIKKSLAVCLSTVTLATGLSAMSVGAAQASTAATPPSGYQLVSGDWNGDGKDETGVFSNGIFHLNINGSVTKIAYGWVNSTPVAGDWNNDGKDEIGFVKDGTWHLRSSLTANATTTKFNYGSAKAVPITGKWNGKTQGIGVRDGNRFLLRDTATPGGYNTQVYWGNLSMKPVAGDWNKDGKDTLGLHTRGQWFLGGPDLRNPEKGKVAYRFGTISNVPAAGDWDGNGSDTPGAALGSHLHVRSDLKGGAATATLVLLPGVAQPTQPTPAELYPVPAYNASLPGATATQAKEIAKTKLAAYNWSNKTQFTCLDNLWMKESRWDYRAANPRSAARGIPQAMVSVHFKDKASLDRYMNNPTVQIEWGLNYISKRYASPCAAWDHSVLNNWY